MSVDCTIINIGTLSMNRFWGETERVRTPSATCTLLQAGTIRLIVDPSPAPEQLEAKLYEATGLRALAMHISSTGSSRLKTIFPRRLSSGRLPAIHTVTTRLVSKVIGGASLFPATLP